MTDSVPLFRLFYVSRNLIPPAAAEAEIERLLAIARQRNAGLGVTGALLFSDDCFAQALEGPRAAVEAVFGIIQRDPRHDKLAVLEATSARVREFGSWSMAHAGRRTGEEVRFAALASAGEGEIRRLAALLRGVLHRAGDRPLALA